MLALQTFIRNRKGDDRPWKYNTKNNSHCVYMELCDTTVAKAMVNAPEIEEDRMILVSADE